jgi:hypothetical protein
VVSLGRGWGVGRRAIAGSSRWSACRGGRGCCGRLLLVVLLLAMRRLRCHGGHVCRLLLKTQARCTQESREAGRAASADGGPDAAGAGSGPENGAECGAIEWAGAGTRACFSSRGLQMLQAARWQIGSGYGAVRTCKVEQLDRQRVGDPVCAQRDAKWLDCRRRWCRTRLASSGSLHMHYERACRKAERMIWSAVVRCVIAASGSEMAGRVDLQLQQKQQRNRLSNGRRR